MRDIKKALELFPLISNNDFTVAETQEIYNISKGNMFYMVANALRAGYVIGFQDGRNGSRRKSEKMNEEKQILSKDEFARLFLGADEKRQIEIKRLLIMGHIVIDPDKKSSAAADPAAETKTH